LIVYANASISAGTAAPASFRIKGVMLLLFLPTADFLHSGLSQPLMVGAAP
jgi:hypothetical protein